MTVKRHKKPRIRYAIIEFDKNTLNTNHWVQQPRDLSYPLWNYSIKEVKRLCAKGRCAVFRVFAL